MIPNNAYMHGKEHEFQTWIDLRVLNVSQMLKHVCIDTENSNFTPVVTSLHTCIGPILQLYHKKDFLTFHKMV